MGRTPEPEAKQGKAEERRRLLVAALIALGIALILLLVAILPAEYGVDPTTLGRRIGFTKLAPRNETTVPVINTTAEYRYFAVWSVATTGLAPVEGYSAEGPTQRIRLPIASDNVTRVTASLTWSDDNETAGQRTEPDAFEVQVLGPQGVAGEARLGRNEASGPGNLSADLLWRPRPPTRSVTAPDNESALVRAAAMEPVDQSARGDWFVNVTLVHAGDAEASGLPLSGPAGDQGNQWRLTIRVETFFLDPARLTQSLIREDFTRIVIPPNRGVEYKLRMTEGSVVEYSWKAASAVRFDFHGDRGDGSSAPTSHKAGTASSDSGSFVAPFTGRHGWYWENKGANDLVIELTTAGVYEPIGRV